jgi:hypothetical protein
VLAGQTSAGFPIPSLADTADLIWEIEGVVREDLSPFSSQFNHQLLA